MAVVTLLLFVLLFVATAAGVMLRRRDRKRFIELMPFLAQRYGISAERSRAHTDRAVRLAALFDHTSRPGHATEARLVSLLGDAADGRPQP